MRRSLVLLLSWLPACAGEVIEGTGVAPSTGGTSTSGADTDTDAAPTTTGVSTTSGTPGTTDMSGTSDTSDATTDPITDPSTSTGGAGTDTTTGEPCGNGDVDDGEQCDDANNIEGDDCTSLCVRMRSCLELLMLDDDLPDGTYTIDPEGDGTAFMVGCDMVGGGWTEVVNEDLDVPEGWSGGAGSQCGGMGSLLGGAGQFGAGATLSKGFILLGVPHTQLRARATVAIIDSWDTEVMTLEVDAEVLATKTCVYTDPNGCNQVVQECGAPTFPDGQIVLAGELAHATNEALLELSTDLDEDANNEAWGLNGLQVYVR